MSDQPAGRVQSATDIARIKRRARMAQMADAGFSQTSTAQALGTSRASVLRFAKSSGVVFAHRAAQVGGEDVIREICGAGDIPVRNPDDYREAIQDMKPLDAVDHLLGLLDGLTHRLPEMSLAPLRGLALTLLEARLLHHLDRHRNRPVAAEALMFAMYQLRPDRDWPDTGIVGIRVCHLRRKLRQAQISGVRIETCRSFGFCLRVSDGVRLDWNIAPAEGTRT
ncbi:MAG: winged helix-turn-helix domain-containing protein [Rhodobacteraceae bacterium]|nr:winged helix-turn-helix domain-containing protein [Paracoccaceae bacterium]